MLQGAFPFDHGPAVEIIGGHLREDSTEIDLAVAERTEAAGALDPALIAAIDTLASGRIELRILDVEHLDAVLVDVDVVEIIEALQDIVRGVVEHVGARVVLHALQEHLEGDAVMQVFARMDFVADVNAVFVGVIEDRRPAAGKLFKGGFDETGRTLRPGIDEGPGKRAREGRMRLDAEMLRSRQRHLHLFDRPFLPRLRVPSHFRSRKTVEGFVIGGMHGNELTLQMGRKFRYLDTVRAGDTGELVAIILGGSCLLQVDELACPSRNLHADIAGIGSPFRDRIPRIEWRGIACELSEKQAGAFDRLHS
ncbi:hypothetical protein RHSP_28535 [Rhizobium freirei PRF 81]|uniref:Uncharacterized protein n=1 Tax=Rhizobium freirei PRF 81 TaxID=363754 RepID=N6UBC3_9HYPH|nr:hypothetical protein RHSP_28535 [Rhizobium freirei PRF 81]